MRCSRENSACLLLIIHKGACATSRGFDENKASPDFVEGAFDKVPSADRVEVAPHEIQPFVSFPLPSISQNTYTKRIISLET